MTVDDRVESPTDTVVSRDVATGTRLAEFPVLLDAEIDRAVLAWAREIVTCRAELVSTFSRENGERAAETKSAAQAASG